MSVIVATVYVLWSTHQYLSYFSDQIFDIDELDGSFFKLIMIINVAAFFLLVYGSLCSIPTLFFDLFPNWGVKSIFADPHEVQNFEKRIRELYSRYTKIVFWIFPVTGAASVAMLLYILDILVDNYQPNIIIFIFCSIVFPAILISLFLFLNKEKTFISEIANKEIFSKFLSILFYSIFLLFSIWAAIFFLLAVIIVWGRFSPNEYFTPYLSLSLVIVFLAICLSQVKRGFLIICILLPLCALFVFPGNIAITANSLRLLGIGGGIYGRLVCSTEGEQCETNRNRDLNGAEQVCLILKTKTQLLVQKIETSETDDAESKSLVQDMSAQDYKCLVYPYFSNSYQNIRGIKDKPIAIYSKINNFSANKFKFEKINLDEMI